MTSPKGCSSDPQIGITKKIENAVVHKNTNNPSNWPFRCTDIAPRSRNSSPAQSCCCDLELTALGRSLFSILMRGRKPSREVIYSCAWRERERERCARFFSLFRPLAEAVIKAGLQRAASPDIR